jgi:hypothetical protein
MAIGTVATLLWVVSTTDFVRERAVDALNQRFDSQVELDAMSVSVFPTLALSGAGLDLRHNGRTDVPPLISVGSFSASAGLIGLYARPFHLRNVTLDRLEIRLPPGGLDLPQNDTRASRDAAPIMLDEIVSRAAVLEIGSGRPGRLPRRFEIHDLVMTRFGGTEGAPFHAGLTNPIPRGRVETSGVFGPWEAADPRLTPIQGEYAFKNANMNDIKGLGGTLSSVGRYTGVLQRIEVDGQAEVPDFSIDVAGQPVPLRTQFKAVVDGTNGDTFLNHVEARLRDSLIIASGSVARTMDIKGRHVKLDVRIEGGRIEDLLQLAVKASDAPLSGRVDVNTTFLLPAGEADVVDRLQLEGDFRLASARFANIDVQQRIDMLSRRGRGIEDDGAGGQSVVSNLAGRFRLNDAVLTFSNLTFSVPGASVQLAGTYNLRQEQMAFAGDLLLDATLPDTLSGWKSMAARIAQPFFRRPGGGSKLPIRIAGPRAKPAFGLDVRRAFWFG